jgi:phospholipase C
LLIFFLAIIHRGDSKAIKRYEEASTTEPSHFKKTQEQEQDKKSKEVLAVAEDKNQHEFTLPHPIWSENEVDRVQITHRKPENMSDRMAYYSVLTLRTSFDLASGYTIGHKLKTLDERSVLNRCIFLETVAGKNRFLAAST